MAAGSAYGVIIVNAAGMRESDLAISWERRFGRERPVALF
jgi:hypothetical protein